MRRLVAFILLMSTLLLAACGADTPATPTQPSSVVTIEPDNGLQSLRAYLLGQTNTLKKSTAELATTAGQYADLVAGKGDARAAWQSQPQAMAKLVQQAQALWQAERSIYQQIEPLVAGMPEFASYDTILDSGGSASDGSDIVAPIDVALADGRLLTKPGNLFSLTKSTLWGSNAAYTVAGVTPDFNGNGKQDSGELLPDPAVLKGAADALNKYSGDLLRAVQDWPPSVGDAFTALVTQTPRIAEWLTYWKTARATAQYDPTLLPKLTANVAALQELHNALSSRIADADPGADTQIGQGLSDLQTFIGGAASKEQAATPISAEEADLIASEVADRVTAITGQVTQAMEQLGVAVETGVNGCSGAATSATATPAK